MSKTQLPAAPLASLLSATGPYAVVVGGNALLPLHHDGELIALQPAVSADPATIETGTVVLVSLSPAGTPVGELSDRTGLYRLNADGDLIAGSAFVEAGQYTVLAVAL